MSSIGYVDWFHTMLFLQQQLSAVAGNGNGAASTLPSGGHNDSDMENHFKSGEYQTLIEISDLFVRFGADFNAMFALRTQMLSQIEFVSSDCM